MHAVAWGIQLLRQHVAHLMRAQQEQARRLEEAARKGAQGGSVFPPPGQMPPQIISAITLVNLY